MSVEREEDDFSDHQEASGDYRVPGILLAEQGPGPRRDGLGRDGAWTTYIQDITTIL